MATRSYLDEAFPADAPLVILHPNFANQHLILANVLNRSNRTPIFYSFQSPATNLATSWELFSTAMQEQAERQPPALEAKTTPEKAAQSALKALSSLQPYVLVIDALDLANQQVENWIAALAKG